jgi:hypothetical protein
VTTVQFFIPQIEPGDTAEKVLGEFAALCRRSVPPPDQRVCQIHWIHDGEEWVANVGERLRGTSTRTRQRRGRRVEITARLSDPATVLAIFSGDPYLVVTNAPPVGTVRSAWVNPFLAGQPTATYLFDPPSA